MAEDVNNIIKESIDSILLNATYTQQKVNLRMSRTPGEGALVGMSCSHCVEEVYFRMRSTSAHTTRTVQTLVMILRFHDDSGGYSSVKLRKRGRLI